MFDVVERWARADPDRSALEFDDSSWSYAELAERVRRAATMLRECGVGPGDRFAVLDENHPVCLELIFAASLTGTTCTAVNGRLEPADIARVLEDAGVRVVVVGEAFVDLLDGLIDDLPLIGDVIVVGDDYETRLFAADPITGARESPPDECFLRLHTAGTEGRPETRRSLVARVGTAALGEVNLVAAPLCDPEGASRALGGLRAGARTVVLRGQAAEPADQ